MKMITKYSLIILLTILQGQAQAAAAKKFEGVLKSYNDSSVVISTKKGDMRVPLNHVHYTQRKELHMYLGKQITATVPVQNFQKLSFSKNYKKTAALPSR